MRVDETYLNSLTEQIIGCAYTVSNKLGCGFLEKVYENALCHQITKSGLSALPQQPIQVQYDGIVVGEYYADLIVEKEVLIELKAVKSLDPSHFAQCMNYLKATGRRICLLINFGAEKIEVRRIVNQL